MNAGNEIQELEIGQVGRDLLRLRTVREESVSRMARSLRRYGQLTPVVVALTKGGYEMVDGFKRLLALMELPGPRRPRTKGKVERPFGYVKGNFLCGRRFHDIEDLNAQARV